MREYICECGKVFNEPAKFNGHKRNCFIHLEACGKLDKLEEYAERQQRGAAEAGKKRKEEIKKRKEKELEQWISEQHTCERCGKVMTEKFGSGRFCCKSCANGLGGNRTEADKQKISSGFHKQKLIPCYCKFCGLEFNYSSTRT